MSTSLFVNFSTSDLDRAKAFYESLGWSINPLFTDDNAACVVIDDGHLYFMVLTREYFASFTDKQLIDPATQAQVQLAFTCDSRAEVDEMMAKGLAAGGGEPREAQDLGFMYSRDLEDPDGNVLGFLYMEQAAVDQGPEAWAESQATA